MSKTFLGGLTNRVLMTIAAGLLILSYCAVFINPAKAWFMTPAGLLFFPLALLNLFLLIWAIIRRSKAFIIPLIALLPTVFLLNRYFKFSSDNQELTGDEIKIVSYNVGRFHGTITESITGTIAESITGAITSQNAASQDEARHQGTASQEEARHQGTASQDATARISTEDSVFNFLKDAAPDIICLQEFSAPSTTTCSEVLARKFPGYEIEYYLYSTGSRNFGNVILSRLPIRNKGVLKFDQSANLAVYADVTHKGRQVRIYNCHFESYNISLSGIVKSIREEEVLRQTEAKMRRSLTLRPRQVEKVMRHIADCPTGTILCGDFNDNPMSYTYQRLIKGHRDTFCEAGTGFAATYSVLWPLLRIDYILVPDDCTVHTHRSPKIPFSDHFPVVAEISF